MDVDENGNDMKGVAEIVIAKHRNGALEDIRLRFIAEQAKFVDYDVDMYNASNTFGSSNTGNPDANFNAIIRKSKMHDDDGHLPPPIAPPFGGGFDDEPAPF